MGIHDEMQFQGKTKLADEPSSTEWSDIMDLPDEEVSAGEKEEDSAEQSIQAKKIGD